MHQKPNFTRYIGLFPYGKGVVSRFFDERMQVKSGVVWIKNGIMEE